MTAWPEAANPWRATRLIYPFYCKLIEQFELEMFPCRDLEPPGTEESPEAMERAQLWFGEADRHIDVSHIREMLQARFMLDEESLRALLLRHLQKNEKSDSDRYKVDFLLGHYMAQNVSPGVPQRDLNLARAAEILEPVLGETKYLRVVEELEACLREVETCQNLEELGQRGVLEKGRELKMSAGDAYFTSAAMIAFTRFNFLVRRAFIHLLENELQAIGRSLSELEAKGISTVDCAAAGLGANESLQNLRQMIKKWRKPFSGKYSDAHWFMQVARLKQLLNQAAQKAPPDPAKTSAAKVSVPPLQAATAPGRPISEGAKSASPPAAAKPAAPAAAAAKATPAAESKATKKPGPPRPGLGDIISQWLSSSGRWARQSLDRLRQRIAAAYAFVSKKLSGVVGAVREATPSDAGGAQDTSSASSPPALPGQAAGNGKDVSRAQSKIGKVIPQLPIASVPKFIKQIAQQVQAAAPDSDPIVEIEGTLFELFPLEIDAFRHPQDPLSGAVQRSAAVRAVLFAALARHHAGDDAALNAVLKMAYSESAMLQERVTQVRNTKGPDAAATLSASARQLQQLIEEAEQSILKPKN